MPGVTGREYEQAARRIDRAQAGVHGAALTIATEVRAAWRKGLVLPRGVECALMAFIQATEEQKSAERAQRELVEGDQDARNENGDRSDVRRARKARAARSRH
jgi:hypothetical protein